MNKIEQQDFYKAGAKKISTEEYNYVDTKYLQIRSVIEFMDSLGYDYYLWDHTFGVQEGKGAGFKGCRTLSWITACNLHNSKWVAVPKPGYIAPSCVYVNKLGGGYYNQAFWADAYTINKALANRIVDQVFLHVGTTGITCYKHQVKFIEDLYEDLFLRPLIEKESAQ